MIFYISCEGSTERWYFEWLQKRINEDSRTAHHVEFKYKNVTPSSFAKSNVGIYTKPQMGEWLFCRVQDIEDYGSYYLKRFKDLLKSNKEAKAIIRKKDFYIAYSNFTFEVWMIAHKIRVPTILDRSEYYKTINRAFGTDFLNNADYKHEDNFKRLLKDLSLDDVIENALRECARFKSANLRDHAKDKRSMYGFDYYLNNPDTTVDDFVKKILKYAGYNV